MILRGGARSIAERFVVAKAGWAVGHPVSATGGVSVSATVAVCAVPPFSAGAVAAESVATGAAAAESVATGALPSSLADECAGGSCVVALAPVGATVAEAAAETEAEEAAPAAGPRVSSGRLRSRAGPMVRTGDSRNARGSPSPPMLFKTGDVLLGILRLLRTGVALALAPPGAGRVGVAKGLAVGALIVVAACSSCGGLVEAEASPALCVQKGLFAPASLVPDMPVSRA